MSLGSLFFFKLTNKILCIFDCLMEQMQAVIPIMLLLKRKNKLFTRLKIGYARKPLFSGGSQWIDVIVYCISLMLLSNKSTQAIRLLICIRVVPGFNLGFGTDSRD